MMQIFFFWIGKWELVLEKPRIGENNTHEEYKHRPSN